MAKKRTTKKKRYPGVAPSKFGLPGRRYPLNTAKRARNALARISQHGTPAQKARVRAKVKRMYPSIKQGK